MLLSTVKSTPKTSLDLNPALEVSMITNGILLVVIWLYFLHMTSQTQIEVYTCSSTGSGADRNFQRGAKLFELNLHFKTKVSSSA